MQFHEAFIDELIKIARKDRPEILASMGKEGLKGAAVGGTGGAALGGVAGAAPGVMTLNPALAGLGGAGGAALGGKAGAVVGGTGGLIYGAAKGVKNKLLNAAGL